MSALARDAKTKLFKNADGILLTDSRNLWRDALNRDKFRGDFLVILCGLAPYVVFRDFQPQLDGFPDIAQGFFACLALAPAAGQRGTTDGEAFIRFNQKNFIRHTTDRVLSQFLKTECHRTLPLSR
jgi:hypothetical protein